MYGVFGKREARHAAPEPGVMSTTSEIWKSRMNMEKNVTDFHSAHTLWIPSPYPPPPRIMDPLPLPAQLFGVYYNRFGVRYNYPLAYYGFWLSW